MCLGQILSVWLRLNHVSIPADYRLIHAVTYRLTHFALCSLQKKKSSRIYPNCYAPGTLIGIPRDAVTVQETALLSPMLYSMRTAASGHTLNPSGDPASHHPWAHDSLNSVDCYALDYRSRNPKVWDGHRGLSIKYVETVLTDRAKPGPCAIFYP